MVPIAKDVFSRLVSFLFGLFQGCPLNRYYFDSWHQETCTSRETCAVFGNIGSGATQRCVYLGRSRVVRKSGLSNG